jgi:hypothetical protein
MKQYLILISLLFALLACSSNGVPPKPPYSLNYQFSTDKNYQYVYRLILNNADSCSKQGVVSKSIAKGQHYSDIKAGDITISLHAPFGKYTHIRVKIDTVNDKTRVSVSNDFERWDELAKVIKDWVENETTFCR